MNDLEEFYDAYVDKVFKFFYINCLDRHTAEDLTSQVFIAFIEKADSVAVQKRKQYLYGIMRNVWTEYLKDKYKQNLSFIENIEDFAVYSEQLSEEYEASPLSAKADKYLKLLPAKQQQVARLRFIEQKSIKQVAAELGKNTRYVKTTQNRAVNTLRKLMTEPLLPEGGAQ